MKQSSSSIASLDTIVRAAIHPAIGIARVGNSKAEGLEGYFIGPEVPEPKPEAPGFYKDKKGALKRQAAKFRVYGLDKHGHVVAELTTENAEVEWGVHVANKKAAWYEFQIALDIPEAATADPSYRRNAEFRGDERTKLAIDPGLKTIKGANVTKGAVFQGTCVNKEVYLGELHTDEAGRLIFLGGHGVAESFDGSMATTFANNDGWYDDTSDGPVTATVKVGDRTLPCDPAWVVTAPPNYAPELKTVRTLHDLIKQVMTNNALLVNPFKAGSPPYVASFYKEVLPIFQRLSGLQWVNKGFAAQFGAGGPFNFDDPEFVAKLAQTPVSADNDVYGELRLQIFNYFRNPTRDLGAPTPWPWIYGDSMQSRIGANSASPNQNTSLTALQMGTLKAWSAGSFTNEPVGDVPHEIAQVPLQEQPATLDQASLDFCLADAFHPGCEITWPIRNFGLYMGLYRIRHRQPDQPEPDYSGPEYDILTPAIALNPGGPLQAQGPGDLTRWMAVPWQTDTSSCRSGYDAAYDPYLPTFWPARVPNQVLSTKDYAVIQNSPNDDERRDAFAKRAQWLRLLGPKQPYVDQVNKMITVFGELGVVERRTDHPATPGLPEVMFVESPVGKAGTKTRAMLSAKASAVDNESDYHPHEFPASFGVPNRHSHEKK